MMMKMIMGAVVGAAMPALAAQCDGAEARGVTCTHAATMQEVTSCGGSNYIRGARQSAGTLDDNCGGSSTIVGTRQAVKEGASKAQVAPQKEIKKKKKSAE
jgi:hypothetical protein